MFLLCHLILLRYILEAQDFFCHGLEYQHSLTPSMSKTDAWSRAFVVKLQTQKVSFNVDAGDRSTNSNVITSTVIFDALGWDPLVLFFNLQGKTI